MQRRSYSRRDRVYKQSSHMNSFELFGRFEVVPGQRVSELSANVAFQTPQLNRVMMNQGMFELYAFYVPFRLIWDDWIDYISEAGTGLKRPSPKATTTGAAIGTAITYPYFLEPPTRTLAGQVIPPDRYHTLHRSAMELVYNQYFGQSVDMGGIAGASWMDINSWTEAHPLPFLRPLNSRYLHLLPNNIIDPQVYEASVASSKASIDVRQLGRSMQEGRRKFRENTTGDKYVDALRRSGVDPDWRIQMAPEFLGVARREVTPTYFTSTSTDSIGKPATRYQGNVTISIANKAFAEAGVVLLVGGFRMSILDRNSPTSDLLNGPREEIEFLGDQTEMSIAQNTMMGQVAATGTSFVVPRGWRWNFGQEVAYDTLLDASPSAGYIYSRTSTADGSKTPMEWLYQPVKLNSDANVLMGDDYAALSQIQIKGLSPVASQIVYGA